MRLVLLTALLLTDGYTASASTMVYSWLKQQTNARFFGRQISGGYNGNNGGTFPVLTLPNTKYQIVFPAYRVILDKNSDQNSGIVPDVIIETNTNSDSLLQEVTKIIKQK